MSRPFTFLIPNTALTFLYPVRNDDTRMAYGIPEKPETFRSKIRFWNPFVQESAGSAGLGCWHRLVRYLI